MCHLATCLALLVVTTASRASAAGGGSETLDPSGDLPAELEGQRVFTRAIRRNAHPNLPPHLLILWSDDLRATYGERGRETLRLNGIEVE